MTEFDDMLQKCQREMKFEFIRAAGPGGQNVNKVATAVQLRFDVHASRELTNTVKTRIIHLAGKRMTKEGILVIEAQRHRTQDQNREDAIARFANLLMKAAEKPKHRWKTKPSTASKEKRLESKKKRGEIKRKRRAISDDL
jgi:ribosome-associated protein